MARESYVQPVMVASEEAAHPWVEVWRFRATLFVASMILAAIAIVFVQFLNGNYQGQDPTFEPGGSNLNPRPAASAPAVIP